MTNSLPSPHSASNGRKRTREEVEETNDSGKGRTSVIDFDKYENIPVEVQGNDSPPPINSWDDINLGPVIKRNLTNASFRKPTPVQKYSLPIGFSGRDLMSCAQTGSGKTAAYLLPIITRLSALVQNNPRVVSQRFQAMNTMLPKALILAPTRELAVQIGEESQKFSADTGLKTVVVYGGDNPSDQLRLLFRGCDILVATPGRLTSFLDRRKVGLSDIKCLVLDEADRMLDMGFEPQIRRIVEQADMPPTGQRQTMMFSATFPKEIRQLAMSFLSNYLFLTVGKVGSATDLIKQQFFQVDSSNKKDKLLEIIDSVKGRTLIFVEKKVTARELGEWMRQRGMKASSIHGDKSQEERTSALNNFVSGRLPYLVATNVAARGLDIEDVAHVINYEMPATIDDYVHRIGRTGRAGKTGISSAFLTPKDHGVVRPLVQLLRQAQLPIPDWMEDMLHSRGPKRSSRGGHHGKHNHHFKGNHSNWSSRDRNSNSHSSKRQKNW